MLFGRRLGTWQLHGHFWSKRFSLFGHECPVAADLGTWRFHGQFWSKVANLFFRAEGRRVLVGHFPLTPGIAKFR